MKASEKIKQLEAVSSSLFVKNQQAKADFKALEFDVLKLEHENEELKKEQQEFQNKLKAAIAEIRAKKGIARFFAALSLLWQLIATIEEGFKE